MLSPSPYIYRIHVRVPLGGDKYVRMICDIVYRNGEGAQPESDRLHTLDFPLMDECHFWNTKGEEISGSSDGDAIQSGLYELFKYAFVIDQSAFDTIASMKVEKAARLDVERREAFDAKVDQTMARVQCAFASDAARECWGNKQKSLVALKELGLVSVDRYSVTRALCQRGELDGPGCR